MVSMSVTLSVRTDEWKSVGVWQMRLWFVPDCPTAFLNVCPTTGSLGCMTKRSFLFALLCLSVPAQFASGFPAKSESRPNVVVFLADDLGYGDVGCHGNPYVKTPQIDAFAREAVEFNQFYVSPVCAPTRASLMTGRYNLDRKSVV